MKKYWLLLAISFLAFLSGCSNGLLNEGIGDPPLVQTEAVTDVYNASAVFHGRLLELGPYSISAHGFVWSKEGAPFLGQDNSVMLPGEPDGRGFDALVEDLGQGFSYFVKAFVIYDEGEEEDTLYGDEVIFNTIRIKDFAPKKGISGSEVIITGENFFSTERAVKFIDRESGEERNAEIIDITNNSMVVAAPGGRAPETAKIVVTVTSGTDVASAESIEDFTYVPYFELDSAAVVRGETVLFTVYDYFESEITFKFDTLFAQQVSSQFITSGVFEFTVKVPYELSPGTDASVSVLVENAETLEIVSALGVKNEEVYVVE